MKLSEQVLLAHINSICFKNLDEVDFSEESMKTLEEVTVTEEEVKKYFKKVFSEEEMKTLEEMEFYKFITNLREEILKLRNV